MSRRDPMFGLVLPRADDTLAATGVGTRDSAYTEAGPGPGIAEAVASSYWYPVITGEQSAAIQTIAIKGGIPTRGTGATVAVRLQSESASDTAWRGWAEPCLVTGWSAPSDYQASNWEQFAGAVKSDDGVIVVVGTITSGSPDAHTWSYDPRTEAWTVRYNWGGNQGLTTPIAMAPDPHVSGRVILWSGSSDPIIQSSSTIAYYSDDAGATWSVYAVGFNTEATPTTTRATVAADAQLDWLMLTGTQYASSDRGITWERIESLSGMVTGANRSAVRGPRGYCVAYLEDASSYPCVRVLTNGRSAFSSATEVVLISEACENVTLSVDDDGSLYAFVAQTDITGRVYVYRSDDGGSSWTKYTRTLAGLRTTDTARGEHDLALWSLGTCHLIGSHTGAPTNGIHLIQCGGWGNVDAGSCDALGVGGAYRYQRLGWVGSVVDTSTEGVCFLPFDTFANQGWTTGGTGTISMTPASGQGCSVATTAGQTSSHFYNLLLATAVSYLCGYARVTVIAGGGLASASTVRVYSVLQDAAATGYLVSIYLGSDGFEVRDGAATVRATVTVATNAPIEFRWMMRQTGGAGKATVWYRVVGSGPTWIRAANDVTLTNAAFGGNQIAVAHAVSAKAETTVWAAVACALTSDWRYSLDAVASFDDTPALGVRGLIAGRPVGGPDTAYPVPILGASGEDVGYIHARGGPVYSRDRHNIPVGYSWPISAINPGEAPSPRVAWRATGTTEALLVWDQTTATWYGGALALVVLNGDFRTCVLAEDNGGAGWTTLGTLDKGWGSLTYVLEGDTIYADDVAPGLTRYFAEGELVGGYVVLDTAGADVARRIVANSAGYWALTGQLLRIRVEGLTGVESVTASTGQLVAPSGVLIAYPTSDTTPRRYLRVQITASQIVPPDRGTDSATAAYGAGLIAPARVVGVGSDPEWQTTRTLQLPSDISRRGDGSPVRKRTGPARRVWSYPWGPQHALLMRSTAIAPDHIAASSGAPIGSVEDAWTSPLGLLEHALRGGELPVVAIARLPSSGTTITDRSMWLYGLCTSDSITISQSYGTEGTDEVLAVSGLTFEELP